jgi:antitoxin ParD1/3/4/toxin ParE1/3/4
VKRFELARRALLDLQGIWDYVADDSVAAADRIIADLHHAFRQLAQMPGMGHRRRDLTLRSVLFWPVHSYLIIYTDATPISIVRVIHASRDVRKLLTSR